MEHVATCSHKAYHALISHSKKLCGLPVSVIFYLFSRLVELIILYASEIWGAKTYETMEKYYWASGSMFYMFPFLVHLHAAVLGELGRILFYIEANTRSINFYSRLNSWNCPTLTEDAFLLLMTLDNQSCYHRNSWNVMDLVLH